MKRLFIMSSVFALFLQCSANAQAKKQSIFPQGKLTADNFTGKVWVQSLLLQDSTFNLVAGSITFSAGARSYWHTHNAGQILMVTDGTGYTQEKGKAIRIIRKGDVVTCLPNVEHWHGASKESSMTHISLNPNADQGVVTWLRPVSDQEYNNTKNSK